MRSDLLCTWVTKAASVFVRKKQDNNNNNIKKNILSLASSFLFFSHTGQSYL